VRRPDPLDPQLAVQILDLATRSWPHGADAFFALFETLRRSGVPLERAETLLSIRHPTFDRGRIAWDHQRGGSWFVEKGGARREEGIEERALARSPRLEGSGPGEAALIDLVDPA
jgi:hypothetical protein